MSAANPKCQICNKTVYPMEKVSLQSLAYHKFCFKCQAEGCGLKLSLESARTKEGKIWCAQHEPRDVPTVTTDSMSVANAQNAPKVAVVSNEARPMEGADRKGTQALSFAQQNQKDAPKVDVVSQEARIMEGADRRGTQALGLAEETARAAPKPEVVSQEVRTMEGADRRGTQALGLADETARSAPKPDVVSQEVRSMEGADRRGTQAAIGR